MTARRINRRLFRRIQRHILAEPKRMDMGNWIVTLAQFGSKANARDVGFVFPACGTIACIAGWARQLTSPLDGDFDDGYTQKIAQRALGISNDDAQLLFHADYWPDEYRNRLLQHHPGTKAYAQVVSDFIDHFLETGE